MKKTVCVFLILVSISSLVFAWNEGYFVDSFGDKTGSGFIYSTTTGQFSSSSKMNAASPLRVTVTLRNLRREAALASIVEFETHEYSMENAIRKFNDDSIVTFRFKDEKGEITTIKRKSSDGYYGWNSFDQEDAQTVIKLFLNNDTVKCNITIEDYSFTYAIDCKNFSSVYSKYFNSVFNNTPLETWIVEAEKLPYKDGYFVSVMYNTIVNYKGKDSLLNLSIYIWPDESVVAQYFNVFSIGIIDSETRLSTEVNYLDISYIKFIKGIDSLQFVADSSNGIWIEDKRKPSRKDFLDFLKKPGEKVGVEFVLSDSESFEIELQSEDLLLYCSYPYEFDWKSNIRSWF